jgi:hypothetical protein
VSNGIKEGLEGQPDNGRVVVTAESPGHPSVLHRGDGPMMTQNLTLKFASEKRDISETWTRNGVEWLCRIQKWMCAMSFEALINRSS